MELTRRDALAALSAVAGGGLAGCTAPTDEYGEDESPELSVRDVETLTALARVLYPSEAENVEGFVEEYAAERMRRDADHAHGVVTTVGHLNDYTETIYGERFASLTDAERRETLQQMGVTAEEPVPNGNEAEQVRYYLVNDLLYAFYATPTGAKLAGLENPPGYPGGTGSYQRGPQ